MMYKILCRVSCALSLILLPISAQTGELIIKDGSRMTINNGSTLTMNCYTITLETGDSRLTNSGTILSLGELIEEPGSTYNATGTVGNCISCPSGEVLYVVRALQILTNQYSSIDYIKPITVLGGGQLSFKDVIYCLQSAGGLSN